MAKSACNSPDVYSGSLFPSVLERGLAIVVAMPCFKAGVARKSAHAPGMIWYPKLFGVVSECRIMENSYSRLQRKR